MLIHRRFTMRRVLLALVSLLSLTASPAFAGPSPQTANFTVSANVMRGCRVSASPLNLGTYDPSLTVDLAPAAGSTISVNCTKGTVFAIEPLTTTNTFQMANGAERLAYALYQEVGHTTNWRTTGTGGTAVSSNTAVTFGVYGVVAAGQDVAEGAYLDTVTVTVTF
jgi:spore coat protein U-like protein